ncbi:MAG TPA: hypothetical protein DCE19_04890 [Gemmatimonadetes bacterium]|nr:hypothetical protein [Gemmatimonadota bacterium]
MGDLPWSRVGTPSRIERFLVVQDKPTDRDGARGRGVGDVNQERQSLAGTTGTLWAVVPQDPHPGVPPVSGDHVVIAQQGDV